MVVFNPKFTPENRFVIMTLILCLLPKVATATVLQGLGNPLLKWLSTIQCYNWQYVDQPDYVRQS